MANQMSEDIALGLELMQKSWTEPSVSGVSRDSAGDSTDDRPRRCPYTNRMIPDGGGLLLGFGFAVMYTPEGQLSGFHYGFDGAS
jgi:hypothetical protein